MKKLMLAVFAVIIGVFTMASDVKAMDKENMLYIDLKDGRVKGSMMASCFTA